MQVCNKTIPVPTSVKIQIHIISRFRFVVLALSVYMFKQAVTFIGSYGRLHGTWSRYTLYEFQSQNDTRLPKLVQIPVRQTLSLEYSHRLTPAAERSFNLKIVSSVARGKSAQDTPN